MWDYEYNGRTVRRRFEAMIGERDDWFFCCVRYSTLAFACYTMSMHGSEVYIAPHYWLIGLIFWYWIW